MAIKPATVALPDRLVPRRALISVFDKTGLVEFARALAARGIELVSTGGSQAAIAGAGIACRDVSDLTGFPEIMDGRVKTLHPTVHGGLLAVRDDPGHAAAMRDHAIDGIDLLVCNLYPFETTAASGADARTIVENIDIGGPAMIRAAAKNHGYVAVIVDPEDYAPYLAALDGDGWRDVARLSPPPCRQGLRPHRRLRLRRRRLVRQRCRRAARHLAKRRRPPHPCRSATARTRIRRRPFISAARRAPASPLRARFRARSSPTTTSTTPTPPTSWSPNSTRPRPPRSQSSSTPTPAAWQKGRRCSKPIAPRI